MDLFPLVFCAFSSSAAATPQVRRRAASEDAEWKGPPCTPACAGLSVPASSDNACQLPQLAPLFIFICPPSHPGKAGPFDPCRPVWPSYASRALGMALGAPWPRASPRRNRRSTICHRRLTCNLHVKGRGAEQRPDVDPRVFGEPRSAADA